MRPRTFVLILWGFLVATAAVAGEEHKMKIEVAVSGDGEEHFEWHGDGSDFDDLEVGESKTIVDEDGNEITMTRTENGMEIEVDGENIELMHMGHDIDVDVLHEKGANVVIHGEHASKDVIVDGHKSVKIIKTHKSDGVTIISSDEIDAETRARLEEILKDAGKDGTVMFIDGSEMSGDEQAEHKREVRVIKKKVDVTN